jgi:hypothetical protein
MDVKTRAIEWNKTHVERRREIQKKYREKQKNKSKNDPKYSIGEIGFKTKKASYEYVKAKMYALMPCLVDKNHPSYKFLADLTMRKPDSFRITAHPIYGKTPHLILINGVEEEDVSWVRCSRFDYLPKKQKHRLDNAMRMSVVDQILDWKREHYKQKNKCNFCMKNVECHVDHIYPFSGIKKEFLKTTKLKIPTLFKDELTVVWFRDEDIEFKNAWDQYHKEKAKYQFLCPFCNMSKGSKKHKLASAAQDQS